LNLHNGSVLGRQIIAHKTGGWGSFGKKMKR